VITRASRAPGLAFEVVRPPVEPSPLRSDVAAFAGPTRRGPVGVPTRVDGWREYCRAFGELDRELDTPYAVRGYFDNGGEVAWIVRLAPPRWSVSAARWDARGLAELGDSVFRISAASPGAWSRRARVTLRYRARTSTGIATIDVTVRTDDELEEHRAIPAHALIDAIAKASQLIRFEWIDHAPPSPARAFAIEQITLDRLGAVEVPAQEDYLAAIDQLADVPEVAIVGFPDLHHHLAGRAVRSVITAAAASADELLDRMVLVDLPPDSPQLRWHADDILAWVSGTLGRDDDDRTREVRYWRAAALYHPWVRVSDPLGGTARPTRDIAPCGHVAGVISALDRARGAHSTPANAPMLGVIDLHEDYDDTEQAVLNPEGVDLLRCVPALGFSVWGGRTLDRTNRFVAHRRLLHRLVRAIRRVAEPLVFEINGPALWFAFVRAVTAVLLDAWRAGALAGERPEQAFRVVCDTTTNPPDEIDLGRCVCLIEVAPAIPMEFILIRVALSRDGSLEVLS
jgi:hypothetical protein